MNNDAELDKPATRRDLREGIAELKSWVLERESSLMWKVVALQVTLIGAISAAQWAVLLFLLQHLQWKAS